MTRREIREVVQEVAGTSLVEQSLADLLAGAIVRSVTEQSRHVSNARFKELVSRQPAVASPREGWLLLLS